METQITTHRSANEIQRQCVEGAVRFLTVLFGDDDLVLFRPIETWTEQGKKKSKVLFRDVSYRRAKPVLLADSIRQLHQKSGTTCANLFFGVCPRFGDRGRYDQAWQIRKVPALWTDIDNVSLEAARERITLASLPKPSITVFSGNGIHAYWLLETPFLIDDASDPVPVETEWIEQPDGRKKPRKFIVESGDKVCLDQRRHILRLSEKARRAQDVLAGIAKLCGGDHTTDLSRLLRIPGSLNRKDQRNGREPRPTELVECEPTRRYSFDSFAAFAIPSPEAERIRKIESMPLPSVRKATAARQDRLDERIAECVIAPAGSRSEPDFALCCFAIENGIDREQVWGRVETSGKFAEQGRRYFDLTWANAEFEVRAKICQKLERKYESKQPIAAHISHAATTPEVGDEQDSGQAEHTPERPTLYIDASSTRVGETLSEVTNHLVAAGNCFLRTRQLVVVHDDDIRTILQPPELAGLLNQHLEFFYVDKGKGEYRPLSTAYANTWLNQTAEHARLPEIRMFTRNPVYTSDWRLVPRGFDSGSGIYCTCPMIAPATGTPYLDTLLQDFCFRSPGDRTNYLGVLVTILLVSHFIGAKPAVLFNGNQPGLGKTILAQLIAILRDGRPTETASFNPNDEEFEKRLGAIVRRGATTIIIDNAKGYGRQARIESACLERSITDAILSFRLVGKSLEIRAENSHIFAITANAPDLSPDLVSRSVVVNLEYEGNPSKRTFQVVNPEGFAEQHRPEILGELIGMVERWKEAAMPMASVHTRFNKRGWGNIVGGILQFNGFHDFLANAEEVATQLDETCQDFRTVVAVMADHPQGTWTATELVELCSREQLLATSLGAGSSRALATRIGKLAGRFVNETFVMADGSQVTFRKSSDRKGNIYSVAVLDEVPNVTALAERLPNVANLSRSAP